MSLKIHTQPFAGLLLLAAGLGLAACGDATQEAATDDAAVSKSDPLAVIDAADLEQHVKVLSSDEFGGREPASEGETLTIEYLRDGFAELGVEPGNGDSWFQEVPLVAITGKPEPLAIRGDNVELDLDVPTQAVTWTKRVTEEVSLDASDLVYVGYGVVAPEYGWNDYAGLDVEGKTVVMLVNDPGYALAETERGELFNGRTMTYYGRWTYKFEEAARQGAAGAIVIHETGPAGYPWEVVSGSWTGPQFDLVSENRNMDRAVMEGWITQDVADQLFGAIGENYESLRDAASQPDFQAIPLNATASTRIENTIRESTSRNVVARIPGSTRPDETIIYTAHWDHLGADPEAEGDGIFNGAVDNATGTGGLIEIAEAFMAAEQRPERSIVFLAVTAEESGLLGSRWYAEHPIYPLAQTVGVINMDSMNVYGPTSDVVVTGKGNSEMEDYLAKAAAMDDRVLVGEEHPERGYFYRSDHFNFAKKGVPALYAESGSSFIGPDAEAAAAYAEAYTAERYHKPADEYEEWFDFSGAIQDLRMYYRVGEMLANSEDWPEWAEGNEFKAAREASRSAD
ncbi:MAG: M28 family metallopeptidase [Gammaproteobacteria bacterium]|nr:M28 family metallopeptidase [Gammaproteobacteria bacterium]